MARDDSSCTIMASQNHISNSNSSFLLCQILSETLNVENFGVDGLQQQQRIDTDYICVNITFVEYLLTIPFAKLPVGAFLLPTPKWRNKHIFISLKGLYNQL